ncbi:MAG TPA: Xaa-Pro peptidase family protein [Verrucomicrobiae bacterium]|jgi:Xaa-Pro aminopeptidase|nr:Xaa-Pro peptidase family protein [Verrucomicrobiae bacterium]
MARNSPSLLIVAASETDANMLYATGFFAPDPFIFFQHRGKKSMVMSDLEIDRAKRQADVDRVLSLSHYAATVKKTGKAPTTADILECLFKEKGIDRLSVPANFPTLLADELRTRRFKLEVKRDPFFSSREKKRDEEVKKIRDSLMVAEAGLAAGLETVKKSRIGRDGYLYVNGSRLTSEKLKSVVNTAIMARGWVPSHTIIASGNQCCDPHNEGSGPIKANSSIIFDIFPRSQKTGYFGDLSRTVVRGRASERLKAAYAAVQAGQRIAYRDIRDGANGKDVHQKILQLFEQRGFPTGKIDGRMQGFFHGTGHGLGLDIHEPPRVSPAEATLRSGHVVTVEPGLYYLGMGGVRLEDVVVVTKTGNRKLTRAPQFLEI